MKKIIIPYYKLKYNQRIIKKIILPLMNENKFALCFKWEKLQTKKEKEEEDEKKKTSQLKQHNYSFDYAIYPHYSTC